MSIEALCQGDKVVKQAATHSRGAMGGPSRAFADGDVLDCLVQTMGYAELRKYNARGSRYHFHVFFASDPALTVNERLKWTVKGNAALAEPIYLRILDAYSEGRPGAEGSELLWVVDAEQETTRAEV